MKTSRFFVQGWQWLIVLLLTVGLWVSVLVYTSFAETVSAPHRSFPAIAGPGLGSGGGPG
jgi:hypothetical protein